MKNFSLLFFGIVLASCSSIKVNYDYDKQADLTQYKTYAFTNEAQNLDINQLVRDRLLNTIESEMTKKGFSKSDNPDMLVDLHVKTAKRTEATANNTGGYYGRYGYWGGMGTTTISYNEYTDGSLFINFIDKSTEKIFWQGTGTKTIDENAGPEKRDKNITYAIQTILAQYPPKK